MDSDKWYLFHILFNIVNYILIKKVKRADTELREASKPESPGTWRLLGRRVRQIPLNEEVPRELVWLAPRSVGWWVWAGCCPPAGPARPTPRRGSHHASAPCSYWRWVKPASTSRGSFKKRTKNAYVCAKFAFVYLRWLGAAFLGRVPWLGMGGRQH